MQFSEFSWKFVSAMIQQPRVPSSGLMPASDVLIRAKEASYSSFFLEIVNMKFKDGGLERETCGLWQVVAPLLALTTFDWIFLVWHLKAFWIRSINFEIYFEIF